MYSISPTGGKSPGRSISIISPFDFAILYTTFGIVVIISTPNSRESRSCVISMCKSPKNPVRKPKPKTSDDSGIKFSEESLSASFSKAARKTS
jgi:hypothetical protein